MQAIVTRYHGPTEYKDARYSATSASGQRVYVSRWIMDRTEDAERAALQKLCDKLDWHGLWIAGKLNERDTAWVCYRHDQSNGVNLYQNHAIT